MQTLELTLERRMAQPENHLILIRRIAAGDEAALGALYDACGQRLFAFALRITGDPAAAEDAVQESLVIVWRDARTFRGESRVLTWLLGIVHHKALNTAAAMRRRPTGCMNQAAAVPDSAPGPEAHAARQERRELLRDAMQRLSVEHRTVLELIFYQGLSLAETARVCACPVGTVKSRLSYAKTALRGALRRAGISVEDIR